MANNGEVGKVIQTVGEPLFEWVIPNVLKLPIELDTHYTSPYFHVLDSNWYLTVYPNGQKKHLSDGWIGLFLHKGDDRPPKTINYTLGIKLKHGLGEAVFTESVCLDRLWAGSGTPKFLKRRMLMNSFHSWLSTLTVTCRITGNTLHPLVERSFVSSATQTEVLNNVIDKEKPKDEDLSSLDIEGITILSERMKDLLIKDSNHDVKITVKDKEFRAHRNILSARSPVFSMMLAHDTREKNTGTINIEDCDPECFDQFLLYVYSGKAENLSPSKALQLYYPADKYDFPVLKRRCVSFLKTSLSVTSICDVVLLAAKHGEGELLELATEFFARNIKDILLTVSWQNFMSHNPVAANELYIKSLDFMVTKTERCACNILRQK